MLPCCTMRSKKWVAVCKFCCVSLIKEETNNAVNVLTHSLIFTVTYKNGDGEQKSFRTFSRFQVDKPLDVKTKFYNAEVCWTISQLIF